MLVKPLKQVEREGNGNRAAAKALTELVNSADGVQLPALLAAFDGASPLAANWLHAAVNTIAQRQIQKTGRLPIDGLQAFLDQKDHDQRARRLAYELIVRIDPGAPERIIPTMLDDPSLEMRRDAVARVLAAGEKALAGHDQVEAQVAYVKALEAARDLDQVKAAVEAMGKLGHTVNVARHFGFLMVWNLIGPFDNVQGKGFDVVYPPETAIDLDADYATPGGEVGWILHRTEDQYGYVDVNKEVGKHMGAVAYATTVFQSDRAQPVELRLGTENANKIWLNGKLLFSAEVYHANGTMDQYVGRGEMKPGPNVILLKICQNEQKEEWAQDWKFQLRVCDASGKAILSTDRPAPRAGSNQTAAKAVKE